MKTSAIAKMLNRRGSWSSREVINFTALVYHNQNQSAGLPGTISRAEGWPVARLRILGPAFVKYLPSVNNVTSNYTNIKVVNQTTVPLELEFSNGFLFPDIATLNFSLTMDPDTERPIGSGEIIISVVVAPICQQSSFFGYPVNTTTSFTGCGGYVTESVGSVASGEGTGIPETPLPRVRLG